MSETKRPDDGRSADGQAGEISAFADLPATDFAHELVGADHGEVPFSLILVAAPPGAGPALHRHPYAEVFVVEHGRAAFQLGNEEFVVERDHVVVCPPEMPHGFRNAGSDELRLTSIHGADRFRTEWLGASDTAWTSRPH